MVDLSSYLYISIMIVLLYCVASWWFYRLQGLQITPKPLNNPSLLLRHEVDDEVRGRGSALCHRGSGKCSQPLGGFQHISP